MVTADVNQHIPAYCGSCWIHGTISALNDRIKIARKAQFPDVMISRQAAMNCVHALEDPEGKSPPPGCDGGDPWAIHSHMAKAPLPDESCQPYEAKNGLCQPANQCRNCFHPSTIADPTTPHVDFTTPGCFAVASGVSYGVSEYGGVAGMKPMQKEILSRGPIVCSFAADANFMLRYEQHLVEGVYLDPSYFPEPGHKLPHNNTEVDHDVEVTGWGTTPGGLPYWVVRNSWGTYWGERGWFKIVRGANHLFIEEDCAWAVPDMSSLEGNLRSPMVGDYVSGEQTAVVDQPAADELRRKATAAAAAAAAPQAVAAAAAAAAPALKKKAAQAQAGEMHAARAIPASGAPALTAAIAQLPGVQPARARAAAPDTVAQPAAPQPAATSSAGSWTTAGLAVTGALVLTGVLAWRRRRVGNRELAVPLSYQPM